MMRMGKPTRWWSRSIAIAVTYIVATDLLPVFLMLIVNGIGYLPYSDRPGPGWQPPHLPSKDELQFFLGFVILLLRPTAIYAVIFAVAGWVFGLCSLPRWVVRVITALPGFLAAGLLMAGVGWMIAISSFGIYVAAGCGLAWAVFVFPLLIHPRQRRLFPAIRILLPVALVGTGVFLLIKPLLPNRAETTATVFVIKQTPLGKTVQELDWSEFGGMPPFATVPTGRFAPVSLSNFSMSDKRKSRVLLVLYDDKDNETKLSVPRTGDAIYSEHDGHWTTLLNPKRNASFGIKLSREFGVVPNGECCHSGGVKYWVFPRQR